MKDDQSIEHLFQEAFEHFEGDVQPQAWQNIQSRIDTPAAGGANSGASSAGSSTGSFGILATITAAVVLTTASVLYFTLSENDLSEPIAQQEELDNKELNNITTALPFPQINPEARAEKEAQATSGSETETLIETTEPVTEETNAETQNNPESQGSSTADNTPTGSTGDKPGNTSDASSNSAGNGSNQDNSKQKDNNIVQDNSPASIAPTISDPAPIVKKPTAQIVVGTNEGLPPHTVSFRNQGEAVAYKWQFGDGQLSSEAEPVHTYDYPGTYDVVLTVTNAKGKTAVDQQIVEVKIPQQPSACDFIPNVITPNGDGINDAFVIQCDELIGNFNMKVFALSGETVFESTSADQPWDGRLPNGELAMNGVYFYQISYRNGSKMEVKTGNLRLIR